MKAYPRKQVRNVPGRGHVLTFVRRDPRPDINEVVKIGNTKYEVTELEMSTSLTYPVTTYIAGAVLRLQ